MSTEAPKKEMLSVKEEDGRTKVSINSSSLGLLQTCPRKSYYLLERGLHSKSPNSATSFGTAYHAALEIWHSGTVEERKLPANYEDTVMSMVTEHSSDYDNLTYRAAKAFVENMEDFRDVEASDKRSILSGLWSLSRYFEHFQDDIYETYSDDEGPFVERQLRAPLYEDDKLYIEYFGQVDSLWKQRFTGQLVVVDHKTASKIFGKLFDRLKPNYQFSGYIYLVRQCLGLDVSTFMVNCIEVKPKPKTSRGSAPDFVREFTTRNDEDIEEFKNAVLYYTRRYLEWRESEYFPIGHSGHCSAYGGCQFLDVCTSPSSIRENIIDATFEER